MLYCTRLGFIFVHNPRTGGSSVARALAAHASPLLHSRPARHLWRSLPALSAGLGWRRHLLDAPHIPAWRARDIFPPDVFRQSFKFGFARNPWDWNVSVFCYIRQTPTHPQFAIVDAMAGFEEFVEWRVTFESGRQASFFHDAEGTCLVDFIGRFERLEADFLEICREIGIDARLPALNASARESDFRRYYTPRTYNLIGDFFRDDIELFGYA